MLTFITIFLKQKQEEQNSTMNFLKMLHYFAHPPLHTFLLPIFQKTSQVYFPLWLHLGINDPRSTANAKIKKHNGEGEMAVLEINYPRVYMLLCVSVSLLLSMKLPSQGRVSSLPHLPLFLSATLFPREKGLLSLKSFQNSLDSLRHY